LLAVLAATLLSACSGSTTSPTATATDTTPAINTGCTTPGGSGCPPLNNTRGAEIRVVASNAWTYTFAGLTVSGNGNNDTLFTGLTPGDLEVDGQIPAVGSVSFTILQAGSNLTEGIVPHSVQSLEGPVASLSCVGVNYLIGIGGTAPQSFRFKFTLASTAQSGC
jgi:hypothetical protein